MIHTVDSRVAASPTLKLLICGYSIKPDIEAGKLEGLSSQAEAAESMGISGVS